MRHRDALLTTPRLGLALQYERGVPLPAGGMLARLKQGELRAQMAVLDAELARLGFVREAGGASHAPTG